MVAGNIRAAPRRVNQHIAAGTRTVAQPRAAGGVGLPRHGCTCRPADSVVLASIILRGPVALSIVMLSVPVVERLSIDVVLEPFAESDA